jgi:nickel/cobalt exporter
MSEVRRDTEDVHVSRAQRAPLRKPSASRLHGVAVGCLLLVVNPLPAHDPPEEYYGRNVTVRLEPACLRVVFRVELSQFSLTRLPAHDEQIQIGNAKGRAALEAAVMDRFKVLVPDRIVAFLNDRQLTWQIERTRIDPADSSHFLFWLRADWKPRPGANTFTIKDDNFADDPGTYQMKLDEAETVTVESKQEPRAWTMKGICPDDYRKAEVVFSIPPEAANNPPGPLPDEPPPPTPPQKSVWEKLRSDDLAALLSTNYGVWLLVLIALVHGAGHSLMPGHGKTMVAAYLVGERGTPWHAVLLGVVTTLTHTSAALIIAVVIRYALPKHSEQSVNSIMLFSGGLLMAGIGLWLFLQRLAGRSDHVHLFGLGHGHAHGDEPPPAADRAGVVRLILLGVAGGIIPCWGAVMWVIGCIATSQFWLALPVVLAFSVGLASVLILIGLSVVYAGRVGKSRFGERRWFKRVFNERTLRWLPVFGAAVVVALGLFLCATSGLVAR